MSIHILSQSLINKIAAGEVIERPGSVVKELMENAVDAGATRIDVSVAQGGLEMIRVVDNGCGIASGELPLAVASHATSKLAREDDLFHVGTLGFRGEALASIAEVSRTVLRSRTADEAGGAEVEIVGGKIGEVSPCGCPVGTAVEVYNLFFNTPVRRKFLRTTQTEFGHVAEAFTRIALATPQVHFTLRHNDKQMFELAAVDGPLERIARFFGRDLADALIWVEGIDGEIKLSGYVAHPSLSRSHNRMQYFFLNGRYIRDRSLQHALGEAYRGLLLTGRYPIAFFTLHMPPDLVDVNVHPTKLEVRFQDSGRLYSQLLSTLRSKFLTTDLNTRAQSMERNALTEPVAPGGEDPSGGHDAARAQQQMRQELVDWAKGKVADWDSKTPAEPVAPGGERKPLGLYSLDPAHLAGESHTPIGTAGQASSGTHSLAGQAEHQQEVGRGTYVPISEKHPAMSALQIHNRYLVTESDEGVMVIDQHALHERILYEQLRHRLNANAMETQNLLVPEPVDLSAAEACAALENRDLLAELGMKIEPFGGDTVLLVGYPAMLANINPVELLRELLDRLASGGRQPDRRDLLDDLLHTVACKAAIKAGDRLNPEEITALLEQRHLVDDAHHCPHGRPAALVFTREELDRQFKRI
ncbi:MAG: DNA mismatch repair endonuclease MutL [Thermoguttaceae bacterium]|jgi:DNA mismatch repair protein MutL